MSRERFNKGDIVYFSERTDSGMLLVGFGMVDEEFSDAIIVDYLVPRERRLVNGIPIEDFESENRFKKLPKGWTWNTSLYEITYRDMSEEERNYKIDITNPDNIKEAYNKGFLVKDNAIFHGVIDDEITKEGYRIVKKYRQWEHHITHTSILPHKVYRTYEEAQKEVDEYNAEFQRQANLSDYDWSLEQIEKNLAIMKGIHGMADSEIQRYRDFFLQLDKLEDVEVRIFGGYIQWKYWKNKRWLYIEN